MADLFRKLPMDKNDPNELTYSKALRSDEDDEMMNHQLISQNNNPSLDNIITEPPIVTSPRHKQPAPMPPMSPSIEKSPRTIELNGIVGFESLPHQVVKKAIERGFHFNLLCVGETGLGKTTLIESLFNMKLEFDVCEAELTTVELRSKKYEVSEGGIRLRMTIVETAGFGDQLDKDKSANVILEHLNEQFEMYFKEELKVRRMLPFYDDTRIHVCLYFISPTGLGLKALDLVTLRGLSKRVNVIPIIAKSDTISKDDLVRFKNKILSELSQNKIEIYQFPTDDETVAEINSEMNKNLPFAVIGSTDFVKKDNGKLVRARRYPWGIVEVENEDHCDFVKLRDALLRTNVDSLRERTHSVLYESYRRDRLQSMNGGVGNGGPFLDSFIQKSEEYANEAASKEAEMKREFEILLLAKEEEMRREEETWAKTNLDMETDFRQQIELIESELRRLNEERENLEARGSKKTKKITRNTSFKERFGFNFNR